MDADIAALESLPLPRTKSELLARIRPARAALDGRVRSVSERQLAAPGADEGWALKDHLAHIATWEDMIAAHLRDGSDHEIVGMEADAYAAQSLDALNDAIYALHKARPVEEVIAHYARAHEHVLSVLNALDDAASAAILARRSIPTDGDGEGHRRQLPALHRALALDRRAGQ